MDSNIQFPQQALNEALAWATGEKSHWNEMMTLEGDAEERQRTLVLTAQADAMEVVKWSSIAQAMFTKEAARRR